ncbi:hypothetical protein [Vitreimonas sp.]|uniref:hypothetical protein n=1 Tax=Vitreimonas sp. TaxID=3069702 RepID=UPI002EDB2483
MEGHPKPQAIDAEFEDIGDQRRGERRQRDRRAASTKLDPLFAATLVNQIATPEATHTDGYATAELKPRRGIVVNVTA